ncbi:MAG: hypothetical protein QOC79_1019 [Actinomycetota bacterium]|nr:hypothetical protein [Actinomycetota bacterium]
MALAAAVPSCSSGSSKASRVSSSTSSTIGVVSTPLSIKLVGGTPVPTTAVQPHGLPSRHVADVLQVAEAIRAGGVGCDTASLDKPKATPEVPGGQLIEKASCGIGDDTVAVTLALAPTIDLSLARMGACFVNKTHPGNLSYVKGINWIAATEQATAQLIAGRLHLLVETLRC